MFSVPSASGLAAHFALIVDGLCRASAARAARNRAAAPLLLLLWSRLRRAIARFASLAARTQAGRLARPRPQAATRNPQSPRSDKNLPTATGWLIRLVPEAAVYGSQLRHLLSLPEMAALLDAAPQAARILRPLCRMLMVPDALPPRPEPPAPPPDAASVRPADWPGTSPRPGLPDPPACGSQQTPGWGGAATAPPDPIRTPA